MNGDYYETLGVGGNASEQEIREAYRKLAFQYHPDRNKDARATERMKAINEAYATLSNPAKRREYDSLRQRYGAGASEHFRKSHAQEDIFTGSDIEQIFQEFSRSFGFRSADDIFREFYGPGFRTYEYRAPGFIFRTVTRDSGQADRVEAPPQPPARPGLAGRALKFLLGRVLNIQIPERGMDLMDTLRISPETIRLGGEVRYKYAGSGRVRTLAVKVPSGIRPGQTIRLRQMGRPGKNGGSPGDLLLKVAVRTPLAERIKSAFSR